MTRCGRGGRGIADHCVQPLEHGPAAGQRRVAVHGFQEGFNRAGTVAQPHLAVADLLIQAAEVRMQGLQTAERLESGRLLAKAALADGDRVQDVAVPGCLGGQLLRCSQRRLVGATLDQRPDPLELGFERCCSPRDGSRAVHSHSIRHSEFVAEGHPDDSRTERRFLDDELIGARKRAGVGIAQVFGEHGYIPVIFRDAKGGF